MKQKPGTSFRKANPVPLSRLVREMVRYMGYGRGLLFERLKRRWPEVVGAANARNTIPGSLVDGLLTIEVTSPAWITQLRLQKSSFLKTILSRETDASEEIRDIRFVTASNFRR